MRDGSYDGLTAVGTAMGTARGLRLAGETGGWSAGAAANGNNDNDGNGKDVNGNGVEKLEERPAPVTDRLGLGMVIAFADRIWEKASCGQEARSRARTTETRRVRMR